MEFRFNPTVVVLVLSIYLSHIAVAMPKTFLRKDEVIPLLGQSVALVQEDKTTITPTVSGNDFAKLVPEEKTTITPTVSDTTYARISCKYDEPTEESICQEHCIPKGYTYGLCTNFTCSCI